MRRRLSIVGTGIRAGHHNPYLLRNLGPLLELQSRQQRIPATEFLPSQFDYRGTVYAARSFDEVLNYAMELRDDELSILYWLMDHAPPDSPATRRPPELESRISPITASFTAPSSSKFRRRPFEAP